MRDKRRRDETYMAMLRLGYGFAIIMTNLHSRSSGGRVSLSVRLGEGGSDGGSKTGLPRISKSSSIGGEALPRARVDEDDWPGLRGVLGLAECLDLHFRRA